MSRVLVVDDDAGMRAALEVRFLRRSWRVETASSAGEALEKFRRGLHPLIVTDIRMPGENGFHLMRQARALAPRTAVILLTAYACVPDAVAAMKDGACDYGMPRACAELGVLIRVVPLSEIPGEILQAVRRRRPA